MATSEFALDLELRDRTLAAQIAADNALDAYRNKRLELLELGMLQFEADKFAKEYALAQAQFAFEKELATKTFGHTQQMDLWRAGFEERQAQFENTFKASSMAGYYTDPSGQVRPTFEREQFNVNTVMNAPPGPADFYAYANRLRGLQGSGMLPQTIGNLMVGGQVAPYSQGGEATPPPMTNTQMAMLATGQDPGGFFGTAPGGLTPGTNLPTGAPTLPPLFGQPPTAPPPGPPQPAPPTTPQQPQYQEGWDNGFKYSDYDEGRGPTGSQDWLRVETTHRNRNQSPGEGYVWRDVSAPGGVSGWYPNAAVQGPYGNDPNWYYVPTGSQQQSSGGIPFQTIPNYGAPAPTATTPPATTAAPNFAAAAGAAPQQTAANLFGMGGNLQGKDISLQNFQNLSPDERELMIGAAGEGMFGFSPQSPQDFLHGMTAAAPNYEASRSGRYRL